MTQYTHAYKRSPFCNNFTDENGVEHYGNCSHTTHFFKPHCAQCQRPADHSVHQVEIGSV